MARLEENSPSLFYVFWTIRSNANNTIRRAKEKTWGNELVTPSSQGTGEWPTARSGPSTRTNHRHYRSPAAPENDYKYEILWISHTVIEKKRPAPSSQKRPGAVEIIFLRHRWPFPRMRPQMLALISGGCRRNRSVFLSCGRMQRTTDVAKVIQRFCNLSRTCSPVLISASTLLTSPSISSAVVATAQNLPSLDLPLPDQIGGATIGPRVSTATGARPEGTW